MREHTLYVLRHGQTHWNVAGRMQGTADSPLTDAGMDQARAQGRILAQQVDVDACDVFCSPRGRALQTAALCLPDQQGRMIVDERLAEIDMGDWTGLFRKDLAAASPAWFEQTRPLEYYWHIPNGETIADVVARVDAFLDELSRPSILVMHGITSRILRCRALGRPANWFDRLPGGQGVVYRLGDGRQKRLIAS